MLETSSFNRWMHLSHFGFTPLCKNIVKRGAANKRELLIYFTFSLYNVVSFSIVSNTSLLDLFRSPARSAGHCRKSDQPVYCGELRRRKTRLYQDWYVFARGMPVAAQNSTAGRAAWRSLADL